MVEVIMLLASLMGRVNILLVQRKPTLRWNSLDLCPHFPFQGRFSNLFLHRVGASDNIARTTMFVSKHGGQSEIILQVKQGDNPTFGFLIPDHHLHSYFRFLVEHPVLLQSEHSGKSQGEVKDVYGEHHNTNGVAGALSLLGSAYGSWEEEDGDCNANAEHELSQDTSNSINNFVSRGSKKMEFIADVAKDVLVSRNRTPSIKEKFLSVKKILPSLHPNPEICKAQRRMANLVHFLLRQRRPGVPLWEFLLRLTL